MRLSIRRKLTLSVCGPMIAIYGGLLLWDYTRDKSEAIQQVSDMFSEKARISADQLATRMDLFMQSTQSAVAALQSATPTTEQQARTDATMPLRASPFIAAAVVVTEPSGSTARTGAVIRRMAGNFRPFPLSDFMPPGQPDPEWYTSAHKSLQPGWTIGAIETRAAHFQVFWYTVPILHEEKLISTLAVAVRAMAPQSLLTGRTRNGATVGPSRGRGNPSERTDQTTDESETPSPPSPSQPWSLASQFGPDGFFIIDRNLRFVSHHDPARVGKPLFAGDDRAGQESAWADILAKPSGAVLIRNLSQDITGPHPDSAHWVAFAEIPDVSWIFVTTIPQSLVTTPIVSQLRHRAIYLIGGVLLVALIIALVSARMSRPIEGLARAVERLSAGDLEARVTGKPSRDEIGTLATGFNSMVDNLKEQIEARAKETAARESIEAELRFARQIQQDLLPDPTPDLVGRPDFDLHALNVPARRVAGDFYDYFFVAGKLHLVIADVSGKGMPAALLMAVARTVVRDYAGLALTPAAIAVHANQAIFDGSEDSMFVTMFLAQYEPATGKLTYVCAGHPPPYILSSNGSKRPPSGATPLGRSTAPLLGVFPGSEANSTIEQSERTLEPGETLFLYTDGVTEARAPSGHMVTEEGLARALDKIGPCDSRSLCERVLAGLQAHESGSQNDDITMLALRRLL